VRPLAHRDNPRLVTDGSRNSAVQVLALARNDAAVVKVKALGAKPLLGNLTDLDTIRQGATEADATIHCGFIHDWANYPAACATDASVIDTMLAALKGTDKCLINTNGTLGGSGTRPFTERDGPSMPNPRSATEKTVLAAAADRGVRTVSIRLAPSVHGPDEHGFVPIMIEAARKVGFAGFVGDGSNIWPAVHVDDAARLFVLALEKAPAGSVLHGVAENVPFKEIASAISHGLGVETRSILPAQAHEALGVVGPLAGLDNLTTADLTKELLDWEPRGKGLIEDMTTGTYFK
jgi:nucleoside-diphosphate-sugar epimerase